MTSLHALWEPFTTIMFGVALTITLAWGAPETQANSQSEMPAIQVSLVEPTTLVLNQIQTLFLRITIPDGIYIPSFNPQPAGGHEVTKLTLSFTQKINWLERQIKYPEPIVVTEDDAREEIYRGTIVVEVPVKPTKPTSGTVIMSGSLMYQPCNDRMCSPVKRVDFKFSIPVTGE